MVRQDRPLSGTLYDEGLAGLDDAGPGLAGGRRVVLLRVVVGRRRRQRAVLRRQLRRDQVRRGGVRVPSQQGLAVRHRHSRPTVAHQPSLRWRVHLVRLVPLSVVAVFVDGTCKVHAKLKSAAFSESASESCGSPTRRKCSALQLLSRLRLCIIVYVIKCA